MQPLTGHREVSVNLLLLHKFLLSPHLKLIRTERIVQEKIIKRKLVILMSNISNENEGNFTQTYIQKVM